MSISIGHILGKYKLVERLGQGGMAEVYSAFQPGVERLVVVKVLHCHLAGDENFVERFQREARAIGSLQHPNIVRIIDVDVQDGMDFMVMDYVTGGTLSSCLKECTLLPLDEALRIGKQLADALAYAHRQGVIHRDIKPANILFTDKTHQHAVLTDFGLARLCDETGAKLTVTGAMVGTPTYMSPEAVRGEACDGSSDIYSLGVVMYEMVTGRPPYVANTPYSMMMKQTTEPLPSPRVLNPALPVAVEEVLLKALAKDPAERYRDAGEMARALYQTRMAVQAEQTNQPEAPVNTPAPPIPARARQEARGLWALAAVSGVLLVMLLTAYLLLSL
jgi:eukaryotic-like serine/threonine-protein kinase